jgi:hypothetical protein
MPKWRASRGVVGSWLSGYDSEKGSERETGLEPATLCLGSRCSTTELLPRECCNGYWC